VIANQRILAVVPARGGSKGIPLKNLRTLKGHSLVGHVGLIVKEVPEIDRVVVSTDHDGIAEEAERYGIQAPFRRPPDLSGDRITDWQVLDHALRTMEELDQSTYDLIVMLQPTAPLRRPAHVRGALQMCATGEWDAVWAATPIDPSHHPLKQLSVSGGKELSYLDPEGASFVARQMLSPTFSRNGAAYVFTRACIADQKQIMGKRTGALLIDEPYVSIDTELDFELANFFWERSGRPSGE
jgi:CMP-N-acetylneuraminic acid synthetase